MNRRATLLAFVLVTAAAPAWSRADRGPSPPGAAACIIGPADGATVSSPVTMRFGLRGMGVAPAGIEKPNAGHHLLIDVPEPDIALTANIPAGERHVHSGDGQTEVAVTLPPVLFPPVTIQAR